MVVEDDYERNSSAQHEIDNAEEIQMEKERAFNRADDEERKRERQQMKERTRWMNKHFRNIKK